MFANVLVPLTRAVGRGLEHLIDKAMGTPPRPPLPPDASTSDQQSILVRERPPLAVRDPLPIAQHDAARSFAVRGVRVPWPAWLPGRLSAADRATAPVH